MRHASFDDDSLSPPGGVGEPVGFRANSDDTVAIAASSDTQPDVAELWGAGAVLHGTGRGAGVADGACSWEHEFRPLPQLAWLGRKGTVEALALSEDRLACITSLGSTYVWGSTPMTGRDNWCGVHTDRRPISVCVVPPPRRQATDGAKRPASTTAVVLHGGTSEAVDVAADGTKSSITLPHVPGRDPVVSIQAGFKEAAQPSETPFVASITAGRRLFFSGIPSCAWAVPSGVPPTMMVEKVAVGQCPSAIALMSCGAAFTWGVHALGRSNNIVGPHPLVVARAPVNASRLARDGGGGESAAPGTPAQLFSDVSVEPRGHVMVVVTMDGCAVHLVPPSSATTAHAARHKGVPVWPQRATAYTAPKPASDPFVRAAVGGQVTAAVTSSGRLFTWRSALHLEPDNRCVRVCVCACVRVVVVVVVVGVVVVGVVEDVIAACSPDTLGVVLCCHLCAVPAGSAPLDRRACLTASRVGLCPYSARVHPSLCWLLAQRPTRPVRLDCRLHRLAPTPSPAQPSACSGLLRMKHHAPVSS